MKLPTEFYKISRHFDVERLTQEVSQFNEDDWLEHPQKFYGNTAIPLVSANGEQNNDMTGPMLATDALNKCSYIQQILASFNTTIGRSRLMRLLPGQKVPLHTDHHYSWRHRVRIHIPIITDPAVQFICNGRNVNMAAGEAWTFDNWKMHEVINASNITRVHLVFDTSGSADFWDLVESSSKINAEFIAYQPGKKVLFPTELINAPVVMDPCELELMIRDLLDELELKTASEMAEFEPFKKLLANLIHDWRCTWSQYGTNKTGWKAFEQLRASYIAKSIPYAKKFPAKNNGLPLRKLLINWLEYAVNRDMASNTNVFKLPIEPVSPAVIMDPNRRRIMDDPVFIVAAPRSGSTLLFETLCQAKSIFSIGGESHGIFENIAKLNPANNSFNSNRLTELDADPATAKELIASFAGKLKNREGERFLTIPVDKHTPVMTFLEKTPKNALRIPFLNAVFPNARFIFLHRSPEANISVSAQFST